MNALLKNNRDTIAAICARFRLKRLDVFGSAAGDNFGPDSDIDFFYEFAPGDVVGIADRFFGLQEALENVLGRPVDLVSAKDAKNPYFLEIANQHRITLYAA